jgi:hypothetical protein
MGKKERVGVPGCQASAASAEGALIDLANGRFGPAMA